MTKKFLVVCSCEREATISRTDETLPFSANVPGWKYRDPFDANLHQAAYHTIRRINTGWYCGRSDHYQESSHELS